jgi:hypothetical protein
MSQWFVNPRRSPRLPVRCPVVVDPGGATWTAETEDVGPRGCQLVLPRPLPVGWLVRLTIQAPAAGRPLPVTGRVAWAGGHGRHRAGIQFSAGKPEGDPTAWFRRLLRGDPALEAASFRAPERLTGGTPLFLRPPPRFIVDLAPEEVALVCALRDGITFEQLVSGAPLASVLTSRLVFALLERRILTLSVGEAAPAWRWHALLGDPAGAPPPSRPSPPERATPPAAPLRPAAPPRPLAAAPAPLPPPVSPPAAKAVAPAAPDLYGAASRRRPAEAQECLDRARAAVAAGEIGGAIALLRRGLALSPRDAEISAELGVLAFRDRTVA